jgi:predicted nucleic acid-binding protein
LCSIEIGSAIRIATDAGIYAYDAYFFECALRMRSPLLTLDRRMKTVAKEIGVQIIE